MKIKEPEVIVGGAVVALVLVAYLANKGGQVVAGAVDEVGGVISGNNVITQSARTTAYQGWGILGTLGAAFDNASGGILSKTGEALGGWTYNVTH